MAGHDRGNTDELRLHLLVLRCQAGDERAFAQLFDAFGTRTLGYLRGLVGEAAEDVQQEVWLAVYLGLRGLGNPRAFRTWLFQTTRHRAIDYLRKRKRETELIEDATLEMAHTAESGPDNGVSAMDAATLDGAMADLAPAHREVLVLRYQQDMSYAQIALVTGCSLGTVRSRLHYAKHRLQELITQRDLRRGVEP